MNITQSAPRTVSRPNYYTPTSGSILIQQDYDGKVRRIGNVFINYDRTGKVKRIGNVYMNYNRGGMLSQVGGLRLTYNPWGELVNSYGIVNTYNSQYNYGLGRGHAFGTYNDNDFYNSGDYYYYRQGDKVKKQKKIKK